MARARVSSGSKAPLTAFLSFWIDKLDNVNSPVLWKRFEGFCEGSWAVFIVNALLAALGILRYMEIWLTVSFADSTRQACLLNGMASCFVAEWVFIRKRGPLSDAFRKLLRIAEEIEAQLEADSDREMQAYLLRVSVRARRWYVFETWHTLVSMCGVLVPPMVLGEMQLELFWLAPRSAPELWLLIALQLLVFPFAYAAYKFFALALNANMCLTALYRALAGRLRAARGRARFHAAARLHAQLDSAATVLSTQFNVCMSAYSVPVLVAAGLATYNILSRRMDLYCLAPGQLILFMFVPICQTGQALEDASGGGLVLAAYSGSWLREEAHAQRLCLAVMRRAAKPARVSARMLGSLNLPICQASLKVWFRYTQLLFNLTDRN